MELHSESQSDRRVLAFRGPEGESATVIVMRRNAKIWLVFTGAVKSTVAKTDQEARQLIDALAGATRDSQRR